ncbi:hypothetical protein HC776_01145 [bacterium]|nr:hypothetical protein [bacterium]
MTAVFPLTPQRLFWVRYWLPSVVAGGLAWLLFLLAETPLIRASGLALVIVGLTLALRRLGAFICDCGWPDAGRLPGILGANRRQ